MAYHPIQHQGFTVCCRPAPCMVGSSAPCGPTQSRGCVQSFNNDAEGCDWNFTTDFWTPDDELHQQPFAGLQPRKPCTGGTRLKLGNHRGASHRDQSPVARLDCGRPSPAGQGWVYCEAPQQLPTQIPSSQQPCQFLLPFRMHGQCAPYRKEPPLSGHGSVTASPRNAYRQLGQERKSQASPRNAYRQLGQERKGQQSSTWWPQGCETPLIGPDEVMHQHQAHTRQDTEWWPQDCNMPYVEPDSSWHQLPAAQNDVVFSNRMPPTALGKPMRLTHGLAPTPAGEKDRDCCAPLPKHRQCTVDMSSCLDPPIEGDSEFGAEVQVEFPQAPASKSSVASSMSLWDLIS